MSKITIFVTDDRQSIVTNITNSLQKRIKSVFDNKIIEDVYFEEFINVDYAFKFYESLREDEKSKIKAAIFDLFDINLLSSDSIFMDNTIIETVINNLKLIGELQQKKIKIILYTYVPNYFLKKEDKISYETIINKIKANGIDIDSQLIHKTPHFKDDFEKIWNGIEPTIREQIVEGKSDE